MVDFDNEALYAKSSSDIEQLVTLQSRNIFMESMRDAYKRSFQGTSAEMGTPKANLLDLYTHIRDELIRDLKAEAVIKLEADIKKAKTIEEVYSLFKVIDEFLDKLKITRLDKKGMGGNLRFRNQSQGWKS